MYWQNQQGQYTLVLNMVYLVNSTMIQVAYDALGSYDEDTIYFVRSS